MLFSGQAMATAATSVSIAMGSIVATRLTGSAHFSGVPATLNLIASAGAAYAAGRITAARGRRFALALGYAVGTIGAAFAAWCAMKGSFAGFLLGSAMVGAANGSISLGRYAAAELVPAAMRGRVVGLILFGAVAGALLTASLTPFVQAVARARGVHSIDLGWLLGAAMLGLGGLIVATLFRDLPHAPEPPETASDAPARASRDIFATSAVRLALVNLAGALAVMVMLMDLIPLHASRMGNELATISQLLAVHFTGMYAFAWLAGWFADRWGARPAAALGASALGGGALLAMLAPNAIALGASLFSIGLGWNFCYVAGSSLLARVLRPNERARTQGSADLVGWLAAAASTVGGGLLFGSFGFAAVGAVGIAASVMVLCAVAFSRGMRAASP